VIKHWSEVFLNVITPSKGGGWICNKFVTTVNRKHKSRKQIAEENGSKISKHLWRLLLTTSQISGSFLIFFQLQRKLKQIFHSGKLWELLQASLTPHHGQATMLAAQEGRKSTVHQERGQMVLRHKGQRLSAFYLLRLRWKWEFVR